MNAFRCRARDIILRIVADDAGQDLVEYALLAGFIGLAGFAALNAIRGTAAGMYSSWLNPTTGVPGLWDPPDPGAGGS